VRGATNSHLTQQHSGKLSASKTVAKDGQFTPATSVFGAASLAAKRRCVLDMQMSGMSQVGDTGIRVIELQELGTCTALTVSRPSKNLSAMGACLIVAQLCVFGSSLYFLLRLHAWI
jgi:hypothetical protein